ncbi:DUF55-domain-containing protein [Pisolithus thermaeus]|nr:DUF55-domain-containing protein [Pisolithus thermaeus]
MRYWLMKAEPDSRVVKGKDVKFSIDDFEAVGTTAWEGVRNFEARNLMKEMSIGDKVLFYHSNCKNPGDGVAQVYKEAYADCGSHPYYDPKTDKEAPKWFMVDVMFVSRAAHFVSLSLLRGIAGVSSLDVPEEIAYVGSDGLAAIKEMALLNRGRLSVQRVSEACWIVIEEMARKGGWEDGSFPRKVKTTLTKSDYTRKTVEGRSQEDVKDGAGRNIESDGPGLEGRRGTGGGRGRKRKGSDGDTINARRRSARKK